MAEHRPLRILHVYPKDDTFTGAAIQLFELVTGLKARGHDVVLATRPSDRWEARTRSAGITYYPVPMRSEVDVRSAVRLARIVRRHGIEVVHAQKGRARTLALMAGLLVKIPVLILNRGVSFPLDPFNRLGYTIGRVTGVVAVCDSIKRGLVHSGVPADKIEVIYSGTDTERFHPGVDRTAIRRELAVAAEEFLVTQIGVRSWKGNDDVIAAMAAVLPAAPRARLLIVGARRPESLYEVARGHGIEARVNVLGYREDIPEILAGSDCCVDASWAGLGLTGTLRESLAVGTPVIGTDLEGNPELVMDGKTGFLVPPRDVPALTAAILRMIHEPELAKAMARRGSALVAASFSTRAKVERTEALYARLLQRQGVAVAPPAQEQIR
jgi:glycosyltransferase involved in cell wall biosynthesis